MPIKIYIAGPDVFRRDALDWLNYKKRECERRGFIGLSPFDNEVNPNCEEASQAIFVGNRNLLNECDVVVANLEPFRGPNVDDGTAFEIGYAEARGIPIYGYFGDYNLPLEDITQIHWPHYVNSKYPNVEKFGHSRNLMIHHAIYGSGGVIRRTFGECLDVLKQKQQ